MRPPIYQIYWKFADGSGAEEQVFAGDRTGQFPRSWTPDGRWLLYQRGTDPATNDLWLLPMEGERKPKAFIATQFNETLAQISPDGRWVAYESSENGRREIYVQAFPGPGGKWQISTDGGGRPVWASGGRELFYRVANRVMAVPVTTSGASFTPGTPRMLFQGAYEFFFDTRDGQRFLMIKGEPQVAPRTLNVVVDWFTELAARMPRR